MTDRPLDGIVEVLYKHISPSYTTPDTRHGRLILSRAAARAALAFASLEEADLSKEEGPPIGEWVDGDSGSRCLALNIAQSDVLFTGLVKTLQRGTIADEPMETMVRDNLETVARLLRDGVSRAQDHYPNEPSLTELKQRMTLALGELRFPE